MSEIMLCKTTACSTCCFCWVRSGSRFTALPFQCTACLLVVVLITVPSVLTGDLFVALDSPDVAAPTASMEEEPVRLGDVPWGAFLRTRSLWALLGLHCSHNMGPLICLSWSVHCCTRWLETADLAALPGDDAVGCTRTLVDVPCQQLVLHRLTPRASHHVQHVPVRRAGCRRTMPRSLALTWATRRRCQSCPGA
jgi:hypothetical protein